MPILKAKRKIHAKVQEKKVIQLAKGENKLFITDDIEACHS